MMGYAALAAVITAVVGFGLDFVSSRSRHGDQFKSTIGATLATFVVTFLVDWGIFFWTRPVFAGAGWGFLVIANLVILAVAFGVANYFTDRMSAASVGSAIMVVVLLVGVFGIWNNWWKGQGNVDKLLSHIDVTMVEPKPGEDPAKAYPNTSDEHMVVVGDQAARFRANQVMSNQGIGTRYELGNGELQSVKGHMYYVFELLVTDWTNSRAVNYTVPGYVLVDAENPAATPEPKLGFSIKLWPGGYFDANLHRYVYSHGYKTVFQDDPTIELDDEGRPFYTMTVNKPVIRWQDSLPSAFLTVDAQSGKITEYPLDKIPSWVDRVYSRDTATYMLDAWGHWGQAPYKWINEGSNNRYKVSGDLNLVYTEDGPAWQALMTSYKSDTAVQYVALMDTVTGKVRMYKAPQGLLVESSVDNSFNKSPNNLKRNDPTALALHKVYGQLTWVASMVGDGEGNQKDDNDRPKAASFAGVGVLNATQSDSSKVIIGQDKGDAFSQYSTQIATGTNNNNPEATAAQKTVTGKVASVSPPLVFNGNTFIIITLDGDKDHLYRGQVTETPNSLAMTVAKPGDEVTITFVETGTNNPIRNIASFSSAALAGVK